MSVTILKIEPIVVSQTLDEPFYFSQWEYQKRTICLVKITTNTGLVGWGEGYGPFGVVKAAIEFFQQLLVTFLRFHNFRNLFVIPIDKRFLKNFGVRNNQPTDRKLDI